MKVGDKYKSFEYNISEVREIEILFIYKECENESHDMILYRYFGLVVSGYFYNVKRRFELKGQINKANE